MNQLDVVITMGGLGSRFQEAGYRVPKYRIEAKGHTLFEWSMMSLKGYHSIVDQYIFIVREEKKEKVEQFIEEQCKRLGIESYRILVIDYLTDGQATTAMLAAKYWKKENGLLIYNIDTYVEAGEMNSEQLKGDGFIPCFQAEGDHWSFVKVDENKKAVEIQEKCRIAENCTVGAYYFRTCGLYEELYKEYYKEEKHFVNGEKYIAPLYNYLLKKGGSIYITDIAPEKVHVLGTPEELEVFLNT